METFEYRTHSRKILADLYTPVGIYLRLRDLYPQSALMESSDYHGNDNSRSFIGINPMASIAVAHGSVICTYPDGSRTEETLPPTGPAKGEACKVAIAEAFGRFLRRFRVEGDEASYCGIYGYTAFNAVRYFENIAVKDTTMEKNDAPDIYYIMYRDLIVFDHFNNTMMFVTMAAEGEDADLRLDKLEMSAARANVKPYGFHPVGERTSTLTDEEHKARLPRQGQKVRLRHLSGRSQCRLREEP